jgi:hypothetical protein
MCPLYRVLQIIRTLSGVGIGCFYVAAAMLTANCGLHLALPKELAITCFAFGAGAASAMVRRRRRRRRCGFFMFFCSSLSFFGGREVGGHRAHWRRRAKSFFHVGTTPARVACVKTQQPQVLRLVFQEMVCVQGAATCSLSSVKLLWVLDSMALVPAAIAIIVFVCKTWADESVRSQYQKQYQLAVESAMTGGGAAATAGSRRSTSSAKRASYVLPPPVPGFCIAPSKSTVVTAVGAGMTWFMVDAFFYGGSMYVARVRCGAASRCAVLCCAVLCFAASPVNPPLNDSIPASVLVWHNCWLFFFVASAVPRQHTHSLSHDTLLTTIPRYNAVARSKVNLDPEFINQSDPSAGGETPFAAFAASNLEQALVAFIALVGFVLAIPLLRCINRWCVAVMVASPSSSHAHAQAVSHLAHMHESMKMHSKSVPPTVALTASSQTSMHAQCLISHDAHQTPNIQPLPACTELLHPPPRYLQTLAFIALALIFVAEALVFLLVAAPLENCSAIAPTNVRNAIVRQNFSGLLGENDEDAAGMVDAVAFCLVVFALVVLNMGPNVTTTVIAVDTAPSRLHQVRSVCVVV